MDQVGAFLTLVVPVLIVFYMAFLLFIRPPKAVLLASLLGGVITGLVNFLVDLAAYYAHWWHYTLSEVTLHVPLPFYISPLLIFGSLAYLLIWRFWHGNARWFSYLLLVGIPLFCIVRDIIGDSDGTSYVTLDNAAIAPFIIVGMWLVAFFAGFFLFWRIASSYRPIVNSENDVQGTKQERHEQTHA
jgi:hypothetical protein